MDGIAACPPGSGAEIERAWWKETILMLMRSCQVIVVDLSKVKEGTAWELNQIAALGLLPKCLFIVSGNHLDGSPTLLGSYFGDDALSSTVHSYGPTGELSGLA